MSRKQFISAEAHLAKFDLTVQDANAFIKANMEQAEEIFNAAFDHLVTTNMLSEITNFSINDICEYFASVGIDCSRLDDTSMLVNGDLGSLSHLINYNNKLGDLSTEVLRARIKPQLDDPFSYDSFFKPLAEFQQNDGVYDAEELGLEHLGNVPANDETIESLFFGSLINIFSALDQSELEKIKAFPQNGNQDDFQALLLESLQDTSSTDIWAEDTLVQLVINESIKLINEYPNNDLAGILDNSFLGLSVA